jgi:Ca2+-binding EF-hand superfamily protein
MLVRTVNISTYTYLKAILLFRLSKPLLTSSSCVTRRNGFDALFSLLKHEGPRALFKGFFPSFVRLGPHFTLTFVFLEQMKRLDLRYKDYQYDNARREALEELFKRVDSSGDGFLDVDEVRDMLRIAFPPLMAPHLSETQYEQLLEEDTLELFRQCDADCSGTLDVHEFLKISTAMEKILHDHNLKAAFAFFDTDHNGRIEVQEFVEILKTMGHRPDGVSEEEFDEAIQQDVIKLMSFLDHDHRGYLDYEAFSRLCPKLGAVQGKRLLKEWIHDSGLHTLD